MKRSFTLGGLEVVPDLTAWQVWWDLNKDPYLGLDSIRAQVTETGNADFYIGKGERLIPARGGRAPSATILQEILPAVQEAMQKGGSDALVQSTIFTLAKIGAHMDDKEELEFPLKWYLSKGTPTVHHSAGVALGVLASQSTYELLSGLALDGELGRRLVSADEVDPLVRSFAAYGLGLLGHDSRDADLRARIVDDLATLLDDSASKSEDLRAAAMVAMGLVPMPVVVDAEACYCGECKVEGPSSSLQSQVTYLMRFFNKPREFGSLVRAHCATTMAHLIEDHPPGMPVELKAGVAEILIAALERGTRETAVVKESAVLALGLIGDADHEELDYWIRWALHRSAGNGGPLERRFALIGLGLAGSRPGQSEEPLADASDARTKLMHHLSNGKKSVRPWAGLGLGVLGHWLRVHGEEPSSEADLAIRNAMQTSKSAADLGAYAIACGMRRDDDAAKPLLAKLEKVKDASTRAHVALGLGILGAREAIEPLQETLTASGHQPHLVSNVATALGLLGDATIVQKLLAALAGTDNEMTEASLVRGLGLIGDERSIEALVGLLSDDESSDRLRASVTQALGRLSDAEPLPWRAPLAQSINYHAATPSLTTASGTGVLDIP